MVLEQKTSAPPLIKGRFDPDDEQAIAKAKATSEEVEKALRVAQNDDYLSQDGYALDVIRDGGITEVKGQVVVFNLAQFIDSRRKVHLMQRSHPATPEKIIKEQAEIQEDNLKDFSG